MSEFIKGIPFKEYKQKYYLANREQKMKYRYDYYRRNREKILAHQKQKYNTEEKHEYYIQKKGKIEEQRKFRSNLIKILPPEEVLRQVGYLN